MDHHERRYAVTSHSYSDDIQYREALHELRLASIRGSLEGVKSALTKGVTVNQPLKGGWTALMFACSIAHPTVVEYLLQQGANPNFHKELFTALMATCASSQQDQDRLVQCVDLLLRHKANINVAERHHITPLMFASKEGHTKVVARLLAEGGSCDVDAQDSQGWTAMFWAVNKGEEDIVQFLVDRKARIDITDRQGQTVLELARNKGLHQIVKILTKRNAPRVYLQPENNNQVTSDLKQKFVFGKCADTLLQSWLEELSSSIINNNSSTGTNFAKLLQNMASDNNLDVEKVQGQVISRLAQSLNGRSQNPIPPKSTYTKNCKEKDSHSVELSWKNAPFSAVEAKEVVCHMVKNLENLYASMSYIRLQMQGSHLVEDKHSRISEIIKLSEKALHKTNLLYSEIYFFHRYAKQLDESERVVPADVEWELKVEPAEHHSRLVSSCVLAAAVVVILFNTRLLTLSVFIK